ncbi:redoxin domain-containing protein [Jannaschia sp.]|nr:redoxin domain-containing protein [Jannaschia sp.]
MTDHPRPPVGTRIDAFDLPLVTAGGSATVGGAKHRWSILFVYRGKHCPRCKRFLGKLDAMLPEWTTAMDVLVASGDPADKAQADLDEYGWSFDLAHGLSVAQMRTLGLYVSQPLSEAETDAPFAEPGVFAFRPDGTMMLIDISNGPAARPDLVELLDGMLFNIKNDRPIRGLD